MRALLLAVFAGFWATSALAAGSSIQPTVPANNAPLLSATLRNNFAAAYADVNALIRDNAGISAPVNPVLGQKWLNTSSTPYFLNEWDGGAWVALGSLNATTHAWSISASALPTPTTTTLGGALSSSAAANQFATGLNTSGALTYAQPSFANLSGTIATGQVSGSYTGITGVGTLASGTWNGVAVGTQFGGLGANNSAATGIPVFAAGVATVTAATGTGAPVRATSPTLSAPVFSSIVNTGTLTLPTLTDTIIGRATTDTLTNKTFDTAGTGNVFKINGTQITANTGTGANVLQTSPALVTPTLGSASATTLSVSAGSSLPPSAGTTQVYEWINSASPFVSLVDSSRTANNRNFAWYFSAGALHGGFYSDSYGAAVDGIAITGGQASGITSVAFPSGPVLVNTVTNNGTDQLQVNGSISSTILKASAMSRLLARNTSSQSIPSGTATQVTNWTTSFDANSNFVASTGVFTAPTTGYYLVNCQIMFNGAMVLGSTASLNIVANAVGLVSGQSVSSNATVTSTAVAASALVQVNSGQTIVIQAFQNSGGAIPLDASATHNFLSITQMP